jgi:iduronate 2-sulfatase
MLKNISRSINIKEQLSCISSNQLKIVGLSLLNGLLIGCNQHKSQEKPNVLFIIVDDLRPELACYGQPIRTPNIDKLAGTGIMFNRAYCNIPVSGASRASMFTGTRPTKKRFLRYDTSAEKDNPTAITLPAFLKNNGYYTIARSKVFGFPNDSKNSWNELWSPIDTAFFWRDYALPENHLRDSIKGFNFGSYPYECADVNDTTYFDGKAVNRAITDLQKLKKRGQPFFLAVGLRKPHLPFNSPKKYWDYYDRKQFKLPSNFTIGETNIPGSAFHNSGELRAYYGVPDKGQVSDSMTITLIHGYYAAVSYADNLIGKLLDELDNQNLSNNTIVVLLGDNGWSLGEHGLWCKHSNFNTSLHTPLIVRAPNAMKGKKTSAITEYLDIYPTICDLLNLKPPSQLEGKSFLRVLKDPESSVKDFAVCKWTNGTTLIYGNHFYTEWNNSNDSVYSRMLFDHSVDPEENNNIVNDPDKVELVKSLSEKLLKNRGADFLKN